MRRVAAAGLALAVAPVAVGLVAVRPAHAAAAGYDSVAATAIVSGVSVYGDLGASGGLATVDGGSARVVATLDGSPSGHVVAAPYEPGGLVRTVVGQVNTNAGRQVLTVPDAEAASPGTPSHAQVAAVPSTTAGPLSVSGGAASADAAPHRVAGTATGTALSLAGTVSVGASTSRVELDADAASGSARQLARTAVTGVDVAGVLRLDHVVGEVAVTASGDAHTATQQLVVGGASVAGQAVTIGNDGVRATGTPLVPGQSLADATAQADAVLARAGVAVRTVGGAARHDSRSATADTGGVLVTVTTPGSPVGGVAGNTLTVLVGQAALTELDAPTLPVSLPGCACPPPVPGQAATTTTTFLPGTPAVPGGTAAPPPTVAAAVPVSYVLGGRRFSARTALVAFAAWQLLSLGVPTLYALVGRRRREA